MSFQWFELQPFGMWITFIISSPVCKIAISWRTIFCGWTICLMQCSCCLFVHYFNGFGVLSRYFSISISHLCFQLSCAEELGKPARELAVIHVSLAATYSDLRQHNKALEHYRHELKLREGNPKEVPQNTYTGLLSCLQIKDYKVSSDLFSLYVSCVCGRSVKRGWT